MRVERRDGTRERKILQGVVTDPLVLARLSPRFTGKEFRSPWANSVAQMCVDYYRSYGRAPGKDVESLFTEWSEKGRDKDTAALVESFLQSLSREYEKDGVNAPYVLDLMEVHFTEVELRKLNSKLEEQLEQGKVEDALKEVNSFTKPGVEPGGVDFFQDREEVLDTFAGVGEPLVTFPGALGQFYGDSLCRDGFVAFLGPEKCGKSHFLLDLGYRAMCQRKRVAFFEVGDMSKRQVKVRLLERVSAHPMRSPGNKWPLTVKYPVRVISPREQGKKGEEEEGPTPVKKSRALKSPKGPRVAEVEFREITFPGPLTQKEALLACEKVRHKTRSKRSFFRLSCHPNSSVSVQGIRGILKVWESQGWLADVIIIDYADILAPPAGRMEVRDQINTAWKEMRALSQEFHCLVVTATQASAKSYDSYLVDRRHFSEDKRKFSHVTGMVGLNLTGPEKERGVMRLNWAALREGEFSSRRCVHVAGCLALRSPCVKSAW